LALRKILNQRGFSDLRRRDRLATSVHETDGFYGVCGFLQGGDPCFADCEQEMNSKRLQINVCFNAY
jgi:hypothetical protein